MSKVVCVGMASRDTVLLLRRPRLEPEAISPVVARLEQAGGKGLLVAAGLRALGIEAPLIALSGPVSSTDPLGDLIEAEHRLAFLKDDHRIWLLVAEDGATVTLTQLAPLVSYDLERAEQALTAALAATDHVYVSMEDERLLRAALCIASAARVPITVNLCRPLLDVTGERSGLLGELVARSSCVICNADEERRALAQLGVSGWEQVSSPNLSEVIVTEGDAGGRWSVAPFARWSRFAAIPAETVSPVGAGDAFAAAYLAARLGGASRAEACDRAARLAAEVVGSLRSRLLLTTSALVDHQG